MSDSSQEPISIKNEMACKSCGALLSYKPGTIKLVCQYCHAENEIVQSAQAGIVEHNLEDFLAKQVEGTTKVTVTTIKCESCGATSTVNPSITADKCPFCATPFVLRNGSSSTIYKPEYLLPFGIDDQKAKGNFRNWLKALWFAPAELANYADRADRLNGMYLPFWTFDCETESNYQGERGIDSTRTVTRTNSNGQSEQHSEIITNWNYVSGHVSNSFDDLLIEATTSLPKNILRALEPWDLKNVVAYNDQYLSGFRTETFQVDLRTAYVEAKSRMDSHITASVQQDIGGNRQRIQSVDTTYRNPKFKYVLLPVWISAYRFQNKLYQFIINARTGEVQGQRPYSAGKIALAVIGGIILAMVLYWVIGRNS